MDKTNYKFHSGAHCRYCLQYHFVFLPKRRKKILVGKLVDVINKSINDSVKLLNGEIIKLHIDIDHVHLLVDLPPTIAPSQAIKKIKALASIAAHRSGVCPQSHMTDFWSIGYFVCTVGDSALERVQKYISSHIDV